MQPGDRKPLEEVLEQGPDRSYLCSHRTWKPCRVISLGSWKRNTFFMELGFEPRSTYLKPLSCLPQCFFPNVLGTNTLLCILPMSLFYDFPFLGGEGGCVSAVVFSLFPKINIHSCLCVCVMINCSMDNKRGGQTSPLSGNL